jgi:DNA modification methylase
LAPSVRPPHILSGSRPQTGPLHHMSTCSSFRMSTCSSFRNPRYIGSAGRHCGEVMACRRSGAFLRLDNRAIPGCSGHPAQFPVKLAIRCITPTCPLGGVVLDPFGGSGTVGVAARKLGRRAILIELNADYAKLATDRLAVE